MFRSLARRRNKILERVQADTVPRPTLTSVSPVVGDLAGNTLVTISGEGFKYCGLYQVTSVLFGTSAATSVTVTSDTSLTCRTPAHAVGAVGVRVVGPGGQDVSDAAFTFFDTPVVSSISPTSGLLAGGTAVTITGSKFTGATGATIGDVALTSFVVVNDTTITGVTGAHAYGAVDVVVTNPVHSGTKATGYTYVYPALTIASVTPDHGPADSTTAVTITGTGFTDVNLVQFDLHDQLYTVVSDTEITATVDGIDLGANPSDALGIYMSRSADGANVTNTTAFTFNASVTPTISSLNYAQGDPLGGGQSIVITGTDLAGATGVSFGGTAATITGTTSTTVTCTLPAKAAGVTTVSVTTPGGTSGTLAFEFWSPASLTLSGWWKADYAGAPWVGTAGGNLVTAGSDPTTGTAQGGFTPASFDGAANYLQSAVAGDTLWTVGAGSIFALYLPTSAPAAAPVGSPNLEPCLVGLSGAGQVILAVNSTGLRCAIYDGAFEEIQLSSGGAAGSYYLGKMKWDSSNLRAGVNSTWGTNAPAGAIVGGLAFTPFVGAENSATKFFAGRLLELGTASTAVADADYDKIRLYCNQRYGVSV